MRAHMNNLHGRNHEQIYGSGAFFDLDLVGRQATMVVGLSPMSECVVASYADKKRPTVVLKTFHLLREAVCPSEKPGESCRVFFGRLIKEVRMTKMEARIMPEYAAFFNKRGDFKRPSAFY